MTDEIRIYHVDDPNDAPDRRLGAFPTINPFLPTSLPQYVIEPVANSLYTAMQYYWYSAYQQGIAAQRQHQQQQQHQHQLTQLHNQPSFVTSPQVQADVASAVAAAATQSNSTSSARSMTNLTPIDTTLDRIQQQQQQQQRQQQQAIEDQQQHEQQLRQRLGQEQTPTHLNSQPPSAASTAPMASSSCSSSSSSSGASTASCSPSSHHHNHHHNHNHHGRNNHLDDHDNHRTERSQSVSSIEQEQAPNNRRHEHIKKPLNPFMIFMQQRRPEIVRQGTIKESAAINQLLGQQWRKLSREEQEPYYKMAEQEKKIHALKYPGWSARDNYANQKKRKKLKLKSISLNGLDQSDKKCRARFGLSNMASWCKPCKRKKKCIYSRHHDRTNIGSNNGGNNTITSNNNHQTSNNLHHQQQQLHNHQHSLPMHHHPLQPFHNPMNHATHGLHSFPF